MTPVDYILAATVCLSVLFGAVRGFLRESVALLGWLVGLWLAWRYAYILEPYLGGALAGTELQSWLARTLVLLAVVIDSWVLGGLLSYLVQRSASSGTSLQDSTACSSKATRGCSCIPIH